MALDITGQFFGYRDFSLSRMGIKPSSLHFLPGYGITTMGITARCLQTAQAMPGRPRSSSGR
jgi:hypothetical protein